VSHQLNLQTLALPWSLLAPLLALLTCQTAVRLDVYLSNRLGVTARCSAEYDRIELSFRRKIDRHSGSSRRAAG